MQQFISDKSITYDYDALQDMLYILFEPITDATFYEDVPDMPGVMRRFAIDDERLVGITIHDVKARLSNDLSQDEGIHKLVQSLVEQIK